MMQMSFVPFRVVINQVLFNLMKCEKRIISSLLQQTWAKFSIKDKFHHEFLWSYLATSCSYRFRLAEHRFFLKRENWADDERKGFIHTQLSSSFREQNAQHLLFATHFINSKCGHHHHWNHYESLSSFSVL